MGVAGVEGFGIDAFVFVVVVVVSLVLVVGVGVDVGCGEHDGIDLVHHHGVSLGTRESGGGERGEVTAVELQTLGLGEDVERLEGCGAIGGVRLGARASAASMLRGGAELVPGRAERGEGGAEEVAARRGGRHRDERERPSDERGRHADGGRAATPRARAPRAVREGRRGGILAREQGNRLRRGSGPARRGRAGGVVRARRNFRDV